MRKSWVIAKREYNAAVRTKAFVVTLVLMPVLMSGSGVLAMVFRKLDDATEKKYAVIDRTPGGRIAEVLRVAAVDYNAQVAADPGKAKVFGPTFELEIITPSPPEPEAMARQRYEISQRIAHDDLAALVEIGPEVLTVGELFADPKTVEDRYAVRFQARNPLRLGFRTWAQLVVNQTVQLQRYQAKSLPAVEIKKMQIPVVFKNKALTRRDPATGELVDPPDQTQVVNMLLPVALISLMFVVIMVGATPAMQGVVEEKTLRIAEVLLGSVTPFQLMAGKLAGVIGVALTMALVYLSGGFALAWYFGFSDMLSPTLIMWFVVMLALALMMFGSIFIAVGAAATDIKDTQTLLMPIMMIAVIPFFALGAIMQDPNGTVARAVSFFPTATPMLMVARESVPPGVPWWEMLSGILLVMLTSLVCIWAAGRIFRIGILLHGKSPRFGDLVQWVLRG
jgi:ABC-2 type transport system permease protein